MTPTVCTSLAPMGQTPVVAPRLSRREKVSVAASLWKTPRRRQVRLHYWTYSNTYITAEDYAEYLRNLMQGRLRGRPVTVLHDEGHTLQEPTRRYQGFSCFCGWEPACNHAPELNPVEAVWHHLKCDKLANFVPDDFPHLNQVLNQALLPIPDDQPRLQTFLSASPLVW